MAVDKAKLYKAQRAFNWGALFGSWLWGFCNRIKHWTVYSSFLLFISAFLGARYTGLVNIGLAIYMGMIGSDLAYNHSDAYYESLKAFQRAQKHWAVVFGFVFLGLIGVTVACYYLFGEEFVVYWLKKIFL